MNTPIFLTEGMTGKQLMANRKATSVAAMKDTFTLSNCIKAVTTNDQAFISSLKGERKLLLNPTLLVKFLTDKEKAQVDKRGGFTYTLVLNLIRRNAVSINTITTPTPEVVNSAKTVTKPAAPKAKKFEAIKEMVLA